MKSIRYFAGANAWRGFVSRFEDVLPARERRRVFYLKGGPGVGKSTFMRRVAEAAQKAGLRVEYFHCSSDPDSLDAIALPERGAAMMDGTAPHVCDPVLPGARDTLVSLGDYLDEEKLRPHAKELKELQQAIAARFAGCYRYLAATKEVLAAGAQGDENPRKARALAAEWCGKLPLRGGEGAVRQLFLAAYTPKGLVNFTPFAEADRVFEVACPLGGHATGLMQRLADEATARGLNVVEALNPLEPEHIDQVLIPEHGIRFAALEKPGGGALGADALFDAPPRDEREQGFDRNASELLAQRASEQLRAAKALHDQLEEPYVRHMDFARWEERLRGVLKALELEG